MLSDLNMYVYHLTAMIFICLSIAGYFICSHVYYECARIFMAAIGYLLYVPQFNLLLVHIHVLYLARLVRVSSLTCFFLRHICFAATDIVVIHELFTVRLILFSMFMYRITFVLKSRFTLHDWCVFHPQHVFFCVTNVLLPPAM